MDGKNLNNFQFADDIVVISSDVKNLQRMIEEVSKPVGLKVNVEKTKIMSPKGILKAY